MSTPQGSIQREGCVSFKGEGFLPFWRKRYLVLTPTVLNFHKRSTKLVLSIPLSAITSINRVDMEPHSFELIFRTSCPVDLDAPRKTIFIAVKNDEDLYGWIDDIYTLCPSMGGVSNPTGGGRRIHIAFNTISGEFTGLPPKWEKLLDASVVTVEDWRNNPEQVCKSMNFYIEVLPGQLSARARELGSMGDDADRNPSDAV
ncbi:hypothetical protein TWF281_010915 [Arthrobotrys megalospora]